MNTVEISNRYTVLANDTCCLSCGGAVEKTRVKKGDTCIDLGSGRGKDVVKLASEVGSNGFVYGVDISDGMIKKARKTAEKLGVKNVQFMQAELENIPVENETVDHVISNCTINHAGDKQAVWNEIFRILKNGGRFVVSDIYSLEEVPIEFRDDPVAVSECWAGAVTRNIYLNQVESAGFKNIKIEDESAPYKKGQITVCSGLAPYNSD